MNKHCFFIAASWHDRPISLQFRTLAKELVALGHQVVLIIDGNKIHLENHKSNPAIYTWPSKRPIHVSDAIYLIQLIRKYQPDCFIANAGSVNIMILIGWIFRICHRIAWYHTVSTASEIEGELSYWKLNLLRFRKRLIYILASKVVANSYSSSQDLQRVYGLPKTKCQVFYNGLKDPNNNLDKLIYDPNKVICVGRCLKTKGQDILIIAISLLSPKLKNVYVEFLGDGPAKESYIRLAHELDVANKCKFLGAVSHTEVLSRMASACVTVVPSRAEAFGLVIIESMSVGTPVIGSQVDGIMEIIINGKEGYLVPTENPLALASQIEILIANKSLREAMGVKGRNRFLKDFELSKIAARQALWFQNLIENNNSTHYPVTK